MLAILSFRNGLRLVLVIYLDEAVTFSAFRAGYGDIELSSSHQLHGFLADVLQVIEEGLEGWSIV